MIGCAPGNSGHDHLIAPLQGAVLLEEQAGHGQQVRRRAGVRHHCVALAHVGGELALEGFDILTHREKAVGYYSLESLLLFLPPGACR